MAGQRFEPKSFCAFAASLNERWQHDNAAVRTTLSRAYYGSLIEARDACGETTKGPGGHQRVIDCYANNGTQHGALIARTLKDMRDWREKADYEPQTECTARNALQMTLSAEKVLKALSITPEPERAKLIPKPSAS